MATMGSTGASALVKSAASAANAYADYQDKIKSLQWESSAQTDAEYQDYSKYLENRITKLSTVGTLSAMSKAMTLTSTLRSANRSYVSNSIQRASQAVMTGQYSTQDKLGIVEGFYNQAIANGDENLAQNLMTQAYSLYEKIQNEAEASYQAQVRQYEMNQKAQVANYGSAITEIKDTLESITELVKDGGQRDLTAVLGKYADELTEMGVEIPEGTAANNGSLILAAINAIQELYLNSATAIQFVDAERAQEYYSKAVDIENNSDDGSFTVMGMKFDKEQADFYAKNPDAIVVETTGSDITGNLTSTAKMAGIVGYDFDINGELTPIFSANSISDAELVNDTNLQDKIKKELREKYGFTVNIDAQTGEIIVYTSDESPDYIKELDNTYNAKEGLMLKRDTNGGYQLRTQETGGLERLLYLNTDNAGLTGIYEVKYDTAMGSKNYSLVSSENGYATLQNKTTTLAPTETAAAYIQSKTTDYSALNKAYYEATVIPDIANKFYAGDVTKAAQDFYSVAQKTTSFEVQKTVMNNLGTLSLPTTAVPKPTIVTPATPTAPAVTTMKPLTVSEIKLPISPTFQTTLTNLYPPQSVNQGLQAAFTGYTSKPKYYTENVIIPEIATKYFAGDVKKAADAVYSYRQTTFGEGAGWY